MTPEAPHALINVLAKTPETIANLANALSDGNLRHRNSPEEFSAIETVCHLRDIEVEGYTTRINRIINEDNPFLTDIDGGRLAIESDYNSQNLDQALQAFAGARAANVRTLRSAGPEQLNRAGTLDGVGRVTLEKLLVLMRDHDDGHLDDLRIICRRLGN
jgi:hypothetical protein